MSLRTHAVVVHPDRWSRPTEELARLLAPITGAEIAGLTAALERGPMTVEADLSPRDAKALQQRLAQLGVPAEVRGADGSATDTGSRPPALPGGLPTEEIPRTPALPRRREVVTEEISRPPLSASEADDDETNGVNIPGALEAMEGPRATDELPRRRRSTQMGMAPADKTPTEGWGALFPDLAGPPPDDEASEEPEARKIPSLDELESEAESIPPSLTPGEPAERRTAELDRDGRRQRSRTVPGGLGGDSVTGKPANEPAAKKTEPAAPSLPEPGASPPEPRPVPETPESHPAARNEPTPTPPSSTPTAEQVEASRSFDGSQLAGILPDKEDRPPYAPNGFDPRPEHPPQVAALLSALAPGAGQVFNGEDDKALSYGLKFWMIKPWIDAVRDAHERAEKIRTYWAPRPESGAFAGAIKYLLAFWLCVALSSTLLYWGGDKLIDAARREPEPTIGPEQIAASLDDAETQVLNARVKGLDAVQEASLDAEPRAQYTMSDKERASRLFALGYRECRSRNYAICEAMMKRISELQNAHRPAIKLQAWASLSQRGGADQPMPDVGEVPTLSELELRHLRQEMALQGENVPPPPEPGEGNDEANLEVPTAGNADAGKTDAGKADAGKMEGAPAVEDRPAEAPPGEHQAPSDGSADDDTDAKPTQP